MEQGPKEDSFEPPSELAGQPCPMCHKNTLTLREMRRDVAYFGPVYIFSMSCTECHYHKSDVECEKVSEPTRHTFEVNSEADMQVRVIKSADAVLKIPRIITIEPGAVSSGYVTNIEGVLSRVKDAVEKAKDLEDEDEEAKKKAKNLIKKLTRVMWGQEPLTIIIEDPTGNSAIISEKTKVERLKK